MERFTVEQDGFFGFPHAPEKNVEAYAGKAVIVLGGSEGNENTPRNLGGRFSREGIAALGLCYWNVPGLPDELIEVPIEPIERAVAYLNQRGFEHVGIYGISKGGELALLAASLIPDIECAIAISPLVSGASVLIRMVPRQRTAPRTKTAPEQSGGAGGSHVAYALIGAATALICAATGAGGPVLVMPILMLLRFPARTAVAVSLLDSVAIAVPSAIGYLAGGTVAPLTWALVAPALVGMAVGTVMGSRWSVRINANLLKGIVAVGSVGIALLKLSQTLL